MSMTFKTIFISAMVLASFSGCASGPEVKQQDYAKLKDSRMFEYEFPVVWHAIEDALHDYVVTNRDPNKVGIVEMKKIRQRTIDTDWVYSRSTEKYIEYKVNDSPRKIYLQTRTRYHLLAKTVLGGVEVDVDPQEEIEKLKDDGSSQGFVVADSPDRSLGSTMLEKINQAILAAPNI
jgi:outer membrane lipoprotein-sorting protein